MKQRFAVQRGRVRSTMIWFTLCLTIVWIVGCQSMIKAKLKSKSPLAQEKFSCGEQMPGRIP